MRPHLFTITVEGDETSSRLVFAESAKQAARLYFAHHRVTKSDREMLAHHSERTIFILPALQEPDLPGVVQWEHERGEVLFFNPRWLEAPAGELGESAGTGTSHQSGRAAVPHPPSDGRAGQASAGLETQRGTCRAKALGPPGHRRGPPASPDATAGTPRR